ncbi:MAG: hypothetical protein JWN14_4123 [Chthonomonadales bacterium]|nr:hypothetical protein [Chthonomonadales bacterium]
MENSNPPLTPKPKRRIGRNLILVAILFLVGVLVAWGRFIADDPVLMLPNPVLPQPNAYDVYVTAGRSLVNSKQIDAAIATKPVVPISLEQKEALVQQNAGVLQTLRQGFVYEYWNPPRSLFVPTPQLATFRSMARLLAVQSQVRAAQHDWAGASDSALDAIRLGIDVPRGGGLDVHGVGGNCEILGQRALWSTIEHLNAAQTRAATQRLETAMVRRVPFTNTIREAKWAGLSEILKFFHSARTQGIMLGANGLVEKDASASRRYTAVFFLLYGKKRVLKDYAEYMDAIAAGAGRPYPLKMLPPPIPEDPINQIFVPVIGDLRNDLRFGDVRIRARSGILLVALALQAYHLDHGRYPASLAELAPAYLKKLPNDPFAMQGSFGYVGKGSTYTLYSVGPDGKDDGGKPIDDPASNATATPRARHLVRENSVGDIVAGINMP